MSLLTDLRFALRLWRRHPTLVIVAGLSLGLGVGATTTMYSVMSKVAHYRLGFKDVDRMVIAIFWQMTSADPLVFSAIAALMLAAALVAAWVPVQRVTRIDPQQALRYE